MPASKKRYCFTSHKDLVYESGNLAENSAARYPPATRSYKIYLSYRQLWLGNTNSYREEYKFAKSFFDDLSQNPAMHKYVRHKGYQAILGSKSLPSDVIEYLMRTSDPVRSINDYVIAKSYLRPEFSNNKLHLEFESKYKFSTPQRRRFWTFLYCIISASLYLFAFSPLFFWNLRIINSSFAFTLSLYTVPLGIGGTMLFTREFVRLVKAIRLIKALESEEITERNISGFEEDHY